MFLSRRFKRFIQDSFETAGATIEGFERRLSRNEDNAHNDREILVKQINVLTDELTKLKIDFNMVVVALGGTFNDVKPNPAVRTFSLPAKR